MLNDGKDKVKGREVAETDLGGISCVALMCPLSVNAAAKSDNIEDVAAGVMGMQALVDGHSAKIPQDFDVAAISTKILSLHRCRLSRPCAMTLHSPLPLP